MVKTALVHTLLLVLTLAGIAGYYTLKPMTQRISPDVLETTARVLTIDNEEVRSSGLSHIGHQELAVEILKALTRENPDRLQQPGGTDRPGEPIPTGGCDHCRHCSGTRGDSPCQSRGPTPPEHFAGFILHLCGSPADVCRYHRHQSAHLFCSHGVHSLGGAGAADSGRSQPAFYYHPDPDTFICRDHLPGGRLQQKGVTAFIGTLSGLGPLWW